MASFTKFIREVLKIRNYRKLIFIKKTDLFTKGKWDLLETKDHLYVYERHYKDEKGLVCCNFSDKKETFTIEEEWKKDNIKLSTDDINVNN